MYIYIYIYIYIHTCIHTYICIYTDVDSTSKVLHVETYGHSSVRTKECASVPISVSLSVCQQCLIHDHIRGGERERGMIERQRDRETERGRRERLGDRAVA